MPSIIDDRVVRMEFDNAEFERNVKTSMHTIDDLKRKLDFSGSADSFNELERSSRNLKFEELSNTLDSINRKFSLWGIVAKTTIENITTQALNSAKRVAASLSIDQATAGFRQYEAEMDNVATMMSAVRDDLFYIRNESGEILTDKNGDALVDTGKKMEYINHQLERLTWYTDETSGDQNAMIKGASTFINSGVELEEALEIMMGITNWSFALGKNAGDAAMVIEQLGQSLAKGYVQVQDWASVENRNLVNPKVTKQIMESAVELDKLVKIEQADGTVKYYINNQLDEATGNLKKYKNGIELATGAMFDYENATEVTSENFRTTLHEGWFTKEVLADFTKQYGNFASELSKIVQQANEKYGGDKGLLTTTWMDYVEEYTSTSPEDMKAREAIIARAAEEAEYEIEDMRKYLELLSSPEYGFGETAMRKSQETRTLTAAIDATKKAAATAWSGIFKSIFGDYKEGTGLFSTIVEDLYTFFIDPIKEFQAGVRKWKPLGYQILWGDEGAYRNLVTAIDGIFGSEGIIRKAFEAIFGEISDDSISNVLLKISEGLRDFTASLIPTEETAEKLQKIFRGLFSLFDIGRHLLAGLKIALQPVFDLIKEIFDALFGFTSDGAGWIETLHDAIVENETFENIGKKIANVLSKIINFVKDFIKAIKNGQIFTFIGNVLGNIWDKLKQGFDYIVSRMPKITAFFGKIKDFFISAYEFVKGTGIFQAIGGYLKSLFEDFKKIFEKDNQGDTTTFLTFVSNILDVISKALKIIFKFASKLFDRIQNFLDRLSKSVDSMDGESRLGILWDFIKRIGQELIDTILPSADKLKEILGNIHFKDILDFAKKFIKFLVVGGVLAAGFLGTLKMFSYFENIVWALGETFSPFMGINSLLASGSDVLDQLKHNLQVNTVKKLAQAALMLAGAIAIIVLSIRMLADALEDNPTATVFAFIGIVALMIVLTRMIESWGYVVKGAQARQVMAGAAVLMVMAGAILAIGMAMSNIAFFDWKSILSAMAAITAIVWSLGALIAIFGSLKDMAVGKIFAAAGAFAIMSVSLLLIAGALSVLSLLNWDALWKSALVLGVLVIALGGVAALLGMLSYKSLIGAAAILIIAGAIWLIVSALTKLTMAVTIFTAALTGALVAFAAISNEELVANFNAVLDGVKNFFKAFTEGLGTLFKNTWWAKLLGLDKFFFLLALAFVAASAGALILSIAIEKMEKPLTNISKALPPEEMLKIAGAFALMVVSAGILVALLSLLKGWSAVGAAALAIAVLSIAYGLKLVADAMVKISEIGPEGINNITKSMQAFGKGVGQLIVEIVRGIKEAIPEIFSLIVTIFAQLAILIPNYLITTIESFLTLLDEHLPTILEKLRSIVQTFMDWLSSENEEGNGKSPATMFIDAVLSLLDIVIARQRKIVEKLVTFLVGLINTLADVIEAEAPRIIAAIDNLIGSLITLAEAAFTTLGEKLGIKMGEGTEGGWRKHWDEKGGLENMLHDFILKVMAAVLNIFTGDTGIGQGIANVIMELQAFLADALNPWADAGNFGERMKKAYESGVEEYKSTHGGDIWGGLSKENKNDYVKGAWAGVTPVYDGKQLSPAIVTAGTGGGRYTPSTDNTLTVARQINESMNQNSGSTINNNNSPTENINITNNFTGLTNDEIVDKVSSTIMRQVARRDKQWA